MILSQLNAKACWKEQNKEVRKQQWSVVGKRELCVLMPCWLEIHWLSVFWTPVFSVFVLCLPISQSGRVGMDGPSATFTAPHVGATWVEVTMSRPRARNAARVETFSVSAPNMAIQAVLSQALQSVAPAAGAEIPRNDDVCGDAPRLRPCRVSRTKERPSGTSPSPLERSRLSPPRRRPAMASTLSIITVGAKRSCA